MFVVWSEQIMSQFILNHSADRLGVFFCWSIKKKFSIYTHIVYSPDTQYLPGEQFSLYLVITFISN